VPAVKQIDDTVAHDDDQAVADVVTSWRSASVDSVDA